MGFMDRWVSPADKESKIIVRATDKSGQVKRLVFTKPFPDGATGYQTASV
jgi:hypothetical protein